MWQEWGHGGDWCNENNRAMQHGKWEPQFRCWVERGIIHSNSAPPLTLLSLSLLDCCYITPSWHHGSFRRVDWRSSWLPEPQSMTMVALWPGRLALTPEVAVVDTEWEERELWPWLEHWHWRHATVSLCLQLHSTLYWWWTSLKTEFREDDLLLLSAKFKNTCMLKYNDSGGNVSTLTL